MNPLLAMLDKHKIEKQQIQNLMETLKTDKIGALGVISSWGIPPEEIQALMGQVMFNPGILEEAVAELGLKMEEVIQAKKDLEGS